MFLLKYVFKVVRLLNSEVSAGAMAAAAAMGVMLGFFPVVGLQWWVVLFAGLFFRINLTMMFFSASCFKLLLLALGGVFDRLGCILLESAALRGGWIRVLHAPLLAWCDLDNSVSLAGTLIGVLSAVPVFVVVFVAVRFYRYRLEDAVSRWRLITFLKGLKIYKLYRRFSSPFEA